MDGNGEEPSGKAMEDAICHCYPTHPLIINSYPPLLLILLLYLLYRIFFCLYRLIFSCLGVQLFTWPWSVSLRKDIGTKKLRALPKLPPTHPPIRATLPTFSGRQKRRFACMAGKNTDDDNNCCHDNFDQNFGNFDDNDDKKYWKTYKYY